MPGSTDAQNYTPAGFALHDQYDAPELLRAALDKLARAAGFVPNHAALLSHSPLLFSAYEELTRLFARSGFSVTEKQLIMLSASRVNNCSYCMAAHTYSAKKQNLPGGLLDALRAGRALEDPRLEALRRFTVELVENRGTMRAATLAAFLAAGYSHEQALEVVLAAALKTITSYADKLAQLPLDEQYAAEAWTAAEV
jgi:uncharacterized peroxidase-related enzyme